MKKIIIYPLLFVAAIILMTGCASNEPLINETELTPVTEVYEEETPVISEETETESPEEEMAEEDKEETVEEEEIATADEPGEDSAEEVQITEEEPKKENQDEADEIAIENSLSEVAETEYHWILNTNTKKVHKPGCSSVTEMKEKNKSESNLSPEELKNQGYEPCKRCNPF